MSYPQPSWPPSPPPLPPHSTEIEHRLTVTEERLSYIRERMALHERVFLAIFSALYIIAQDQFPAIAAAIRRILTP